MENVSDMADEEEESMEEGEMEEGEIEEGEIQDGPAIPSIKERNIRSLKLLMVGDERTSGFNLQNWNNFPIQEFCVEPLATLKDVCNMVENKIKQKYDIIIIFALHWDFVKMESASGDYSNVDLMKINKNVDLKELVRLVKSCHLSWSTNYPDTKVVWTIPYPPDFFRYNSSLMSTVCSSWARLKNNEKHQQESTQKYWSLTNRLIRSWDQICPNVPFFLLSPVLFLKFQNLGKSFNHGFTPKFPDDHLIDGLIPSHISAMYFGHLLLEYFYKNHIISRDDGTIIKHYDGIEHINNIKLDDNNLSTKDCEKSPNQQSAEQSTNLSERELSQTTMSQECVKEELMSLMKCHNDKYFKFENELNLHPDFYIEQRRYKRRFYHRYSDYNFKKYFYYQWKKFWLIELKKECLNSWKDKKYHLLKDLVRRELISDCCYSKFMKDPSFDITKFKREHRDVETSRNSIKSNRVSSKTNNSRYRNKSSSTSWYRKIPYSSSRSKSSTPESSTSKSSTPESRSKSKSRTPELKTKSKSRIPDSRSRSKSTTPDSNSKDKFTTEGNDQNSTLPSVSFDSDCNKVLDGFDLNISLHNEPDESMSPLEHSASQIRMLYADKLKERNNLIQNRNSKDYDEVSEFNVCSEISVGQVSYILPVTKKDLSTDSDGDNVDGGDNVDDGDNVDVGDNVDDCDNVDDDNNDDNVDDGDNYDGDNDDFDDTMDIESDSQSIKSLSVSEKMFDPDEQSNSDIDFDSKLDDLVDDPCFMEGLDQLDKELKTMYKEESGEIKQQNDKLVIEEVKDISTPCNNLADIECKKFSFNETSGSICSSISSDKIDAKTNKHSLEAIMNTYIESNKNSGIDIIETLQILDRISVRLGPLGIALSNLYIYALSQIKNGKSPISVLDEENKGLLLITLNKLDKMCGKPELNNIQKVIFQETYNHLSSLVDTYDLRTKNQLSTINIPNIAYATIGKDPSRILSFIKTALIYEGYSDVKDLQVMNIYMSVKQAQSKYFDNKR